MNAQSVFDTIRKLFLDIPDKLTAPTLGGIRTALGVALAIAVVIFGLCTGPNLPLVAIGLSNFFIAIGVKGADSVPLATPQLPTLTLPK